MKKTVADVLLDTAEAAGVRNVYGLLGDALDGLAVALRERAGLRFVRVRHQEAGSFAAGGEANVTGRLAVCVGSCGPGSVQLLNGLYDCHRSHLPVLAIVAQVPRADIGSGGFQETHPQLLFQECSHFCEQITVPEQAVRLAEAAVQAALSLGGVSVLIVPADVFGQVVEVVAAPVVPALGHASAIVPASTKIAEAAALLNGCERVTILAGSGVEGAHAELLLAAQTMQAPIVHSLNGQECVQPHNPFDVGMSTEPTMPAARLALDQADGILLLGTDFPLSASLSTSARVVQVEKQAQCIGRHLHVEVGLHGTVDDTLLKLLPHLRHRTDPSHLHATQRQHQLDLRELAAQATGQPGDAALRPQQLTQCLSDLAPDDTIFVCDIGMTLVWAGRYLAMNGHRRLINSFVHGSPGAALPQALGAAAASPGRPVVALCGDGGLSMLLGELLTLRQEQLPVKIIVFNNHGYRGLAEQQQSEGVAPFGTRLLNPDFAQLAEVMGLRGLRASDPANLAAVLREALAHDGPVVVDAQVHNELAALRPPSQATTHEKRSLLDEGRELLQKVGLGIAR